MSRALERWELDVGAGDVGQVEVDGLGSEPDVRRARDFFGELRRCRGEVVPLVGAGLSVAAGGLPTADLRERLRDRAEHEGVGGLEDLGLYELADREPLTRDLREEVVAGSTRSRMNQETKCPGNPGHSNRRRVCPQAARRKALPPPRT